jgi:hypothetical protein
MELRIPIDRRVGNLKRGVPGSKRDLNAVGRVVLTDHGSTCEDRVETCQSLLAINDHEPRGGLRVVSPDAASAGFSTGGPEE